MIYNIGIMFDSLKKWEDGNKKTDTVEPIIPSEEKLVEDYFKQIKLKTNKPTNEPKKDSIKIEKFEEEKKIA